MADFRTDLAVEAREIWEKSAGKAETLPGVEVCTRDLSGFEVTSVKITCEEGENALGKPRGEYVTLELDELLRREDDAFSRGASALAGEIRSLLKLGGGESVLVAGLGNEAVTPDSIGPKCTKYTMATRHLAQYMPQQFGTWRRVSVIETGVLGTTGLESAEIVRAVCEKLKPDRVIAVDALCSASVSRVCRTVQLTDAGIVPGSGVGNSRAAINESTVGVPVIAVGVPTVTDAATVAAELSELAGISPPDESKLRSVSQGMIVTPREIDVRAGDISKLIAYGINLALHDGLTVADIDMFVS